MTIVILIILATISVNVVIQGGLINKTASSAKLHDLEKERERLELIKAEVASNPNNAGKVTVENYVKELVTKGIIEESEIENGETEGSKKVVTDAGYSVIIKPRGENDVEIEVEGKAGQLPPVIKEVKLRRNSDNIVIEVIAKRTEGAKYSYYKKEGTNWVAIEENSNNTTATWTGTNDTDEYTVKVVVKNEYGFDDKEETSYVAKAGEEITKPSTWGENDKVKAISDGKGGAVPLPDGYYYVGGDYDSGLVISDKRDDTLDASGTSMGSQFVWIPVSDPSKLVRTDFNTTTGKPQSGLSTTYTEPYASGYTDGKGTEEEADYTTMKTQVLKYGGFFIGRFEAGINSTTPRTAKTEAQAVVSKRGVAPYNYVPWGTNMSTIGNDASPSGAVYLAQNKYMHPDSVTSTLVYGCQWDAMCRYIGDSQRTTPTKSALGLTGSVSTDMSKNIYDLAGNCFEWTMEARYTNSRVRRGGYCLGDDPVSRRRNYSPDDADYNSSFRCALYISNPGS